VGNSGLLRLFQIGLEQACRNLKDWEADTSLPPLRVSLNLPSEGLVDDNYSESVLQALDRWGVDPGAIQLEILESADPFDVPRGDAKIAEFQRMGLKVVQDDLGAGHSSLLRFDRIPFDGVKIDQALVRRAQTAPWRALEFIHHLVSLSHDMHVPVAVEGLESDGLIEAATILGADLGQGFGIARPMPADQLPDWIRSHAFNSDPTAPRTILGLLAKFLLWDREALILSQNNALSGQAFTPWAFHLDGAGFAGLDAAVLNRLVNDCYEQALIDIRGPNSTEAKQKLIAYLEAVWLRAS
jgi:EAL domain-containing protein (putative c-di-GMP-specific phosphodiesterase class I)